MLPLLDRKAAWQKVLEQSTQNMFSRDTLKILMLQPSLEKVFEHNR